MCFVLVRVRKREREREKERERERESWSIWFKIEQYKEETLKR